MEFDDYTELWKEYEKIANEGRFQDALLHLSKIENKAVAEKNDEQILKSVFYRYTNSSNIEENPIVNHIAYVENVSSKLTNVGLAISQSYLAELYFAYLQQNQYKLRNLTDISSERPANIEAWSMRQLIDRSSELYLLSISNPDILAVNINSYNAIIENLDSNGKELRTNLYDLLAHRVIDYFNGYFPGLTEPVYAFIFDQEAAFSPSSEFINFKFDSEDTNSKKLQVLKTLQNLEKFHQASEPKVLLDIIGKRLDYAYQNNTADNKNSLYEKSLTDVLVRYRSEPSSVQILAKLADYHINQASNRQVDSNQENVNNHYIIAHKILTDSKSNYKDKNSNDLIDYYISRIELVESNFEAEKVFTINDDFPVFIRFRNAKDVEINLYKLSEKDLLAYYLDNKLDIYTNSKNKIRSTNYKLPVTNDYNFHTYEIVEKGLPIGAYVMEMSDKSGNIKQQLMYVSNISFSLNNNDFIQFMDRKTGEPITNATIQEYTYNWNGRNRNLDKLEKGSTDKDGIYRVRDVQGRGVIFKVNSGEDELFLNDYVSVYKNAYRENPERLYTFTDRSIYRPGQKIYFKSILTTQIVGQEPAVISNRKITVILKNANYQDVETKSFTTNEFGSIHGEFLLPQNLLNGRFTLEIRASSQLIDNKGIQIEEYKRPKFYVETDSITADYKLGQEVKFTGSAKTYTESPVDGAKVTYKITRSQPYRYYYRWYNPQAEKVIKVGETTTDNEGKYAIDFIAEPDKSQSLSSNPVFTYLVEITVTDISGETRTTTKSISAGTKFYAISIPQNLVSSSESAKNFPISVTNISGDPVSADLNIKLESLDPPANVYKSKYWEAPEYQQLEKKDYYRILPGYAFKDENLQENWPVKSKLKSEKLKVIKSADFNISNLPAGFYKITVEHPEAVSAISYVQIISDSNNKLIEAIQIKSEKITYEVGETAQIDIYSAYPNMKLFLDISRIGKDIERKLITVNEKYSFSIPVLSSDRGGISFSLSGVIGNRFHQEGGGFSVPYTDKNLALKWESFRSDLLPGSKEKWSLTLKDYKGKSVDAEVLSSMYDASLDEFMPHSWNPFFFNNGANRMYIKAYGFSQGNGNYRQINNRSYFNLEQISYPFINTMLNFYGYYSDAGVRGKRSLTKSSAPPPPPSAPMEDMEGAVMEEMSVMEDKADGIIGGNNEKENKKSTANSNENPSSPDQPIRKNLNETVFFMPTLRTNENGETILEFTMNEALTSWKLQTLAHTKDVKFVLDKQTITTSKDLMVFPTGPRFFREDDKITLPAKIQNMSDGALTAKANLVIKNAASNEDITSLFIKSGIVQEFNIPKGQSAVAFWNLTVPSGIESITYQIFAESGEHKDGEENTAIVLPNRKLVTESQAIFVPANSKKNVNIISLDKMEKSATLDPKLLQISVTSNPSWLAIQSLPYLMEFPYKCSEQVFARFYANKLGAHILKQNPGIEAIYAEWRDKGQLVSALSKNEELKSATLQQTPWVMDALSEEEQMQRLCFLFDLVNIQKETAEDLELLISRQNGGGFPWFPGGRPNWYITQHILEGLGQLDKMGVISSKDGQISNMIKQGLSFLESEVAEYERNSKSKDYVAPIIIHYMYVRSFFPEYKATGRAADLIKKYEGIAEKTWLDHTILTQGQLALHFHRKDNAMWANKIVESLRQRTIYKENLGRYWKEVNGYFWYNSNIESQAMMIATFDEIAKKDSEVNEMKMWLLSNKQTNSWKSTKATTQAIYALIERGEKWINNDKIVSFSAQNKTVEIPADKLVKATGQYDVKYRGESINKSLQNIEFTNDNSHIAWASTSFQYWEDLDKIEDYQETPLKLRRTFFKKVTDNKGTTLVELKDGQALKPGDLITVRIQLIVDRPMEFIHLQDMRASGTEPIDVISTYKYNAGLYYYMETRDAATNFFVDNLASGEYTIEYDQRAVQAGEFSAGISTIQSMYAPEFGAHSAGKKITIVK